MSFLKELFGKKTSEEKVSRQYKPLDAGVFFSEEDRKAQIRKKCRFIDHVVEGIQVVSVDTNVNGTYEVYRCSSRTTALQFLRSIPQDAIPPLYYVVVETPAGNLGKDLKGIFDESTGIPISQERGS